ncbi:WD repeat-containing protein 87-like [Colossoma macropomum]|uniref:WD repeat-containing protein 87-like n=1 Tax=Colossoma macropomum TaxID=42526 RepID=UPI001864F119|nr:WD repeat-containing protein 87-like [Colossoma macropomum]
MYVSCPAVSKPCLLPCCLYHYLIPPCQEREEDGHEHDEDTLYLDAAPSIQFRYSCVPNYIQCLTAFTGGSGMTVVGFQWGHKLDHRQMKVWKQNKRGKLAYYKSVPMENNYKVENLIFIPSQRAFVGACSDLSLRVFSGPGQGMVLQYRAILLGSVLCMHYCKDTEELLTGGIGIITFWGFWTSLDVQLGIVRVLDWNCCSLRSDSTVCALVTEQQSSTLYALCDRRIKSFHLKHKKELRSFCGRGQGNLRCVLSNWVQRYLYTGDISGCVQVWSQDSRSLLQEFHAHSRCVSAMVLRPNTQTLLTSSQDGWVKEWSCCGELLAKLFLDDSGGVRSMWLINEHQILCHSLSSFYVWQLQSIYKPFHSSGCGLQYLQRVECGPGRTRILAMSQDSIVQIISPVSGEMLLLSWPFLLLERALAFAYNPGQENLLVAFGTPEVLVLDTSLCPCPAKGILCVSKHHDQDESVMSLEVVMMAGADNRPPPCLVFSGHRNGKLQLLSAPPRFHCQARKAHQGAVLQISSLPGPKAQLCCCGEDEQLSVWSVEVRVERVELALIIRISPHSRLMLTKLMPGLIFAVSPGYSLLLYSLVDDKRLAMERNPPTAITCMDYCAALGLVAVSGPAGIVEVWDNRGIQLAEVRLGAPVSQVCFANARGDLLACFSGSISIIAGVRYLPVSLLKQVLVQAPPDDLLEDPVPFLPRLSSSYDLGVVPKVLLKPGEAAPELEIAHSPSTVKTIPEPDLDTCRGSSERTGTTPKRERRGSQYFTSPAVKKLSKQEEQITTTEKTEPESLERGQLEMSQQQLDVEPVALGWPVAPDGFIPNSVIRNWGQNQEQQVPEKSTEAKALQGVSMDKHLDERVKVTKVRAQRISKPVTVKELSGNIEVFTEPELEEEDFFKKSLKEDLLKKIAQSQWLAKKPKTGELDSVMRAVMLSMDCVDPRVYISCAEALYSLREAYGIPPEIKKELTLNLVRDFQKGNPNWKRLDALKTLLQMDLLLEKDLFAVAEALTDEGQDLRQLARDAVAQVYSINTKETLLARLHHTEVGPTRQVETCTVIAHSGLFLLQKSSQDMFGI